MKRPFVQASFSGTAMNFSDPTARGYPEEIALTGADVVGATFVEVGGEVQLASDLSPTSRVAQVIRRGDVITSVNGKPTAGRVGFLVIQELQSLSMSSRSKFSIGVSVPPSERLIVVPANRVQAVSSKLRTTRLVGEENGALLFDAECHLENETISDMTRIIGVSGHSSPVLSMLDFRVALDNTVAFNSTKIQKNRQHQLVLRLCPAQVVFADHMSPLAGGGLTAAQRLKVCELSLIRLLPFVIDALTMCYVHVLGCHSGGHVACIV